MDRSGGAWAEGPNRPLTLAAEHGRLERIGRGIAPVFPFSVILASPICSPMFNVTLQDGLSIRTTGPAEPVTLEVRTPSVILTARLTAAGERVLLRVLQHRYDGTPLPDAPGVAAVPVPTPVSAP